MSTPEELLDALQPELELAAEEAESLTGVDRRQFMFMSLMAAAATTFSGRAVLAQRGERGMAALMGTEPRSLLQQQAPAPFPLGNGEPPAEQFMPWPGGTGDLMETMVKKYGAKMFDRISSAFKKIGFRFVAIDVDGYRSGALNETLTHISKLSR